MAMLLPSIALTILHFKVFNQLHPKPNTMESNKYRQNGRRKNMKRMLACKSPLTTTEHNYLSCTLFQRDSSYLLVTALFKTFLKPYFMSRATFLH